VTIATIVGGVLGLFIAVAAFMYLSRHRATPDSVGRVLRLLAFAATIGIVIALLPFTVADSGASAGYLLGVPVVAAVCPLIADLTGRAVGITTTVGALVMLVWGLILGLGIGSWFLLPALLLGIAVVARISSRRAAVSRQSGWISPVVVGGGVVRGTWELDADAARVAWFREAGKPPRRDLHDEVARLSSILGRELRPAIRIAD